MRISGTLAAVFALTMALAAGARADDDIPIALPPGQVFHFLPMPEFPLVATTPATPDVPCGLKLVESYPMQLDGGNHIVVPVRLDKRRLMIVDTGGVRSTLYSSVAKEMNLAAPQDDFNEEVGVGGDVSNKLVHAPDLSFGIIQFHDATFNLIQDSRPLPLADNEIAGTLGPSHLMTFDVDFDFNKGAFNLFAQDHCPGKAVYWARDYVSVPFTISGLSHIQFPMQLDGKPVTVTLDSGSPTSFLNFSDAKTLFGLDAKSPGVEFVGYIGGRHDDDARVYRYRFKHLSMQGIDIRNPMILLIPDQISASTGDRVHLDQMVLGLREMVHLHLYIAYGEHMLYATAADAALPAPEAQAKAPPAAPPKPG
jgi:hypothetical protein